MPEVTEVSPVRIELPSDLPGNQWDSPPSERPAKRGRQAPSEQTSPAPPPAEEEHHQLDIMV
jgi:hypothetical protein